MATLVSGLSRSPPIHQVGNMFQPPCSIGSFLARREVTEDQSIAWMSAFMPISRQALPTTSAKADEIGISVGCMMTVFSPL